LQSSSVLRRSPARALPELTLPRLSEGRVVFGLTLCLYLVVAVLLVFAANIIQSDALSRVGNAEWVLYSRDPHLAAIGFVWNPLPSLLVMPLLPFKVFFPQLVQLGFAANLVSALFMAGAVYQLWGIFSDLGLGRGWRLLLTLLFALHPMIVFYGANGMSEAPFIFFLILATRCLASWLKTPRLEWQVYTGLSLGAAYLCRYEALPAGLGALAIVAIVSWARARGHSDRPFATAVCDSAIVAGPFLLAVAVWAGASFVIVGHPFEQFSSIYGNGSQMRTLSLQANGAAAIGGLGQLLALEPLLLVIVTMALLNAALRRELRLLAVLAVLCPVLMFAAWAHMTGAVAPWIRYFIVIIPLSSLLAGIALSGPSSDAPRRRRWLRASLGLLTTACLASAAVLAGVAMTNPAIAPEEGHELAYLAAGGIRTADEQRAANRYLTERAIAGYLDQLNLPGHSVLVDTFIGFPIVLSSNHPDQFVITSDRDFKQSVADPAGTGIRYLLVPRASGLGTLDAVNQAYPGIYGSGGGVGRLVKDFPNIGDGSDWRLYRVSTAR
jgi:dolichyl-phosphate-mannose-protein mannosyltransferase